MRLYYSHSSHCHVIICRYIVQSSIYFHHCAIALKEDTNYLFYMNRTIWKNPKVLHTYMPTSTTCLPACLQYILNCKYLVPPACIHGRSELRSTTRFKNKAHNNKFSVMIIVKYSQLRETEALKSEHSEVKLELKQNVHVVTNHLINNGFAA